MEGIVRLTGAAPAFIPLETNAALLRFRPSPDPALKYVPVPNAFDHNEQGLRSPRRPLKKPDGVFRISVLGDSIAYGTCNDKEYLPAQKTFPQLLEDRLNARSFKGIRRVEVLNFSVPGYDTRQEVAFFKVRGKNAQTDLALLAYCLNDMFDASAQLEDFQISSAHARSAVFLRAVVARSALARWAWAKTALSAPANETSDRVREGFSQLGALGRSEHFKTLVAVFPFFEEYLSASWPEETRDALHKAAQAGFETLDLRPVLEEKSGGDLKTLQGRCDNEHLDERGHRAAAEALEAFLLERSALGKALIK